MPHTIPDRIVIATHNQGKLREFQALLAPYGCALVSSGQMGLAAPDETGSTFAENAVLKARIAAQETGMVALADDSGLCVSALDGRPGIYSARWSDNGDFYPAMERINREIGANPDRAAHFITVLALCWPDGYHETVAGRVDGTIAPAPRGTGGHGYDPIFIPNGDTRTFAEMHNDEKNAVSHRAVAARILVEKFFAHRKS